MDIRLINAYYKCLQSLAALSEIEEPSTEVEEIKTDLQSVSERLQDEINSK